MITKKKLIIDSVKNLPCILLYKHYFLNLKNDICFQKNRKIFEVSVLLNLQYKKRLH